jgi:hypothetical protein
MKDLKHTARQRQFSWRAAECGRYDVYCGAWPEIRFMLRMVPQSAAEFFGGLTQGGALPESRFALATNMSLPRSFSLRLCRQF